MTRAVVLLLVTVSSLASLDVSAQDAKNLSDADIAKLLVGKWRWEDKTRKVEVDMIVEETTFTTKGINGDIRFETSGTWKVEKGALELTIKKSTLANREGATEVHKIFAIDNKMLSLESKDVAVFKRQK